VAFKQESRRSLLAADPNLAHQPYQRAYSPQPGYVPNNINNGNDYSTGGYYDREGFAPSNPNSLRKSKMDFLKGKWPKAFMLTTTLQAILCLSFEAYVSQIPGHHSHCFASIY